jgi:hypothetical protein
MLSVGIRFIRADPRSISQRLIGIALGPILKRIGQHLG